jgi:hypothetical protein
MMSMCSNKTLNFKHTEPFFNNSQGLSHNLVRSGNNQFPIFPYISPLFEVLEPTLMSLM